MLVGYPDRFSIRPGERLPFFISTDAADYSAELVRLRGGDPRTLSREERETSVEGALAGRHAGGVQPLVLGSYAVVPDADALRFPHGVTVQVWVAPTRPAAGREQLVLARWSALDETGFALGLDERGRPFARLGGAGPALLRDERELLPGRWYALALTAPAGAGAARLRVTPLAPFGDDRPRTTQVHLAGVALDFEGPLLLAGAPSAEAPGRVEGAFDGKLEAPVVLGRAAAPEELATLADASAEALCAHPELVALWDFAREPSGTRIIDRSPHGLHGTTRNLPVRVVTGRCWNGEETDWRRAPEQYGAIHFHTDAIADVEWEPSLELAVPDELESGVYALRLTSERETRALPFVVTPRTRARRVVLLLPWFSYLAYANDVLPHEIAAAGGVRTLCLYSFHRDGAGCCTSSGRRPLLHLSPDYTSPLTHAPRHLTADLLILRWLEHEGVAFDVITDRELHRDGVDALAGCDVLITGAHPEYVSWAMLTALERHLGHGGSLMYLGGNGFYWVTSTHDDAAQAIEVRRGHAGTREWTSEPGEVHHASSGELGGLWRHRGRAPQRLAGVGFAAQGWGPASGYRRTAASRDPRWAELFAGLQEGERFGRYGAILGGAAGDEIDRADVRLGTPPDAAVIASSEPHDAQYQPAIEDVLQTGRAGNQEMRALVRSDVLVHDHPGGGQVFSVGSMAWVGSLAHAGYENDVARLTSNALRRALRRGA